MQKYLNRYISKFNAYKSNNLNKSKNMIPYTSDNVIFKRSNSFTSNKYHSDVIKKGEEENKKKSQKQNNSTHDSANISTCTNHHKLTINEHNYALSSEMYKKKYERILLIEKYTMYDDLRKQGFKDDYIFKNFFRAYISHLTHTIIVNNVINLLRTKYKSHVSTLKAYKKNIENIFISSSSAFSPDAIFSIGGDGTYLESAHIIANKYIIDGIMNRKGKKIELIGINSDPKGSEGKLCLNYLNLGSESDVNYDYETFEQFEKIHKQKKKMNIIFSDISNFINKSKIRGGGEEEEEEEEEGKEKLMNNEHETSNGKNNKFESVSTIDDIILRNNLWLDILPELKPSLQNKQDSDLFDKSSNENTIATKFKEKNKNTTPCFDMINCLSYKDFEKSENAHEIIISIEEYTRNILSNFFEKDKYKKIHRKYITVSIKKFDQEEIKTYKSINEVYIYEAVKNNICTYINVDKKFIKKLKSTALLITSGTGSTAWAYNVNKIDKKKIKIIIEEFLNIQSDTVKKNIKNINFDLFSEYINNSICFHPNSKYMKCIIKEPIENNVYDSTDHIYKCEYINLKTCTNNTIVYIDGIYNIKTQPNDSITLHINEDDFIESYK